MILSMCPLTHFISIYKGFAHTRRECKKERERVCVCVCIEVIACANERSEFLGEREVQP